jgi:exosortase
MSADAAVRSAWDSFGLRAVALAEKWAAAPVLLLLAALWLRMLATLVLDWKVDPQYPHGWFVPVLALVLFATRWPSRPRLVTPERWVRWPLAASLLLLAPITFLQIVYPEARPFMWGHALLVTASTFLLLVRLAGRRWALHFAFPILFVLLAVPWPRGAQNQVTGALMHRVAAVAVEATQLWGIPATQHGSTIALPDNQRLGVDEACSGVRSLQGCILVALFLGSYFPLRRLERVGLLAVCVAAALVLNVLRAIYLTYVAAHGGTAALARYHDPAGLLILGSTLLGATLLALFFARGRGGERTPARDPAEKLSFAPAAMFSVAAVVWLAAVEVGSRAYFGPLPSLPASTEWQIDLGRTGGVVTAEPFSPTARQYLRFDRGQGYKVELPSGSTLRVMDLQWQGGEISAAGARLHQPAICLPSVGYQAIGPVPDLEIDMGGVPAKFSGGAFSAEGVDSYVFHALWENGRTSRESAGDQSLASAWKAIKERRRLVRARVLLAMLTGPATPEQAAAEFKATLEKALVPLPSAEAHGHVR